MSGSRPGWQGNKRNVLHGLATQVHKLNLGNGVAEALLDRPDQGLWDLPLFRGAGIYVIYYKGDLPLRRTPKKLRWPIYIGKAAKWCSLWRQPDVGATQ